MLLVSLLLPLPVRKEALSIGHISGLIFRVRGQAPVPGDFSVVVFGGEGQTNDLIGGTHLHMTVAT